MDPRFKATDNFTVSAIVYVTLGSGDGSIRHVIICPGNVGGNTTSCASIEINGRVLGANVTKAQNNVTRVFITEGSSTSFEGVTADGTSDNVTATQAIMDTKSTTTPIFGEEAILITESDGFSSNMETFIKKRITHTSFITKDNVTLTECTSGTCSTSASSVFGSTVTDRIVLD